METLFEPWGLAAIMIAMVLGGILKGATGAGIPVIAVPVIAAVHDVKTAVAVMVLPNLISNLWQVFKFRDHRIAGGFSRQLVLWAALGTIAGTAALASLSAGFLNLCMAAIVIVYIALRIFRPSTHLSMGMAKKIVVPVSLLAGVLQGAVGVSAPVAVTYLNAMRLARPNFIFTISVFFSAMAVSQVPAQLHYGLLTAPLALLGLLSLLPLLIALPIGDWIGRRTSPKVFDSVILTFLGLLALRLIYVEVFAQ